MTKHLIWLVSGAFLFAIGLSDLVANSHLSPYIILAAGLVLGTIAVLRIQRRKPQ